MAYENRGRLILREKSVASTRTWLSLLLWTNLLTDYFRFQNDSIFCQVFSKRLSIEVMQRALHKSALILKKKPLVIRGQISNASKIRSSVREREIE